MRLLKAIMSLYKAAMRLYKAIIILCKAVISMAENRKLSKGVNRNVCVVVYIHVYDLYWSVTVVS